MKANNSKSYTGYLNKLEDEYNNTYHLSICKKPADADYFALTEGIELSHESSNFKVGYKVRITKYKNICVKGYIKN